MMMLLSIDMTSGVVGEQYLVIQCVKSLCVGCYCQIFPFVILCFSLSLL